MHNVKSKIDEVKSVMVSSRYVSVLVLLVACGWGAHLLGIAPRAHGSAEYIEGHGKTRSTTQHNQIQQGYPYYIHISI